MKLGSILQLGLLLISSGFYANAQSPSLLKVLDIIKHREKYEEYVLVSAHRGYWSTYPENSEEAYRMAIELGADIIEMDVRITEDDVMVVFHDACLDRITTGYGRLREANWSYVNSLNLRNEDGSVSQYPMLSLTDALDYLKDKAVIALDIKEKGRLLNKTMKRVLAMLKEKDMLYQSIIKGTYPLQNLQLILKEADVTLDDFIYTPKAYANTPNMDSYIMDFVGQKNIYAMELVYKQSKDPILRYVPIVDAAKIWVGQYSFWPELGDGVIAEKIPLTDTDPIVRPYDFQDKDPNNFLDDGRGNWEWLLGNGATYVITDRSELLIEFLEKLGFRHK